MKDCKMKDYGFVRVAAAVPVVSLADPAENAAKICELIDRAEEKKVSLVVFPELCVTGYSCADLFGQNLLIEAAEKAVESIAGHTEGLSLAVVVGVPVRFRGHLYNCAAVLHGGKVCGIVPKIHLPNYGEFYEKRQFTPGSTEVETLTARARERLLSKNHLSSEDFTSCLLCLTTADR